MKTGSHQTTVFAENTCFSDLTTQFHSPIIRYTFILKPIMKAEVAELADALASGASEDFLMGVRIPPSAPGNYKRNQDL